MYTSGMRRIHLVELIDANRKKTTTEKGWQPIGRKLIRTHHCTFLAVVCTLRPASGPIIPDDVRHRCAGSCRHHLRDMVQAVVAMRCDWEMPGRLLEVEVGYEGEDVGARSAAGIMVVAKAS